jgi:hypothetical protein
MLQPAAGAMMGESEREIRRGVDESKSRPLKLAVASLSTMGPSSVCFADCYVWMGWSRPASWF